VEIVETEFEVLSKNELDLIVISADELMTSPEEDAPRDLDLAVFQLI
jgi:hypothetical protein